MNSPLETIRVPVHFSGFVDVSVPGNAPNKKKLAQVLALSRAIATTENPDAPDEDALDEYRSAIGVSDDNTKGLLDTARHFDGSVIVSISGAWNGEPVPNERGLFPGDFGFTNGPGVTARMVDDANPLNEISFDASAWLEKAGNEDIKRLADMNWRSSDYADRVADFFARNDSNANPRILDFITKNESGYEVCIEEEEAMEWILAHRPHLAL